MKLTLSELKYHTATEDMTCDACQMFWSIPKPDYKGIEFSDVLLFFRARYGRIRTGERYLELLFVDDEDELFSMNVLEAMHKFMFRMSFYPEIMLTPMLEYRKQKKLQTV
jgi:predicted nucleotidyltransferase